MTLSFYKVQFDAQEVLDLVAEVLQDHESSAQSDTSLADFESRFVQLAEERSRV